MDTQNSQETSKETIKYPRSPSSKYRIKMILVVVIFDVIFIGSFIASLCCEEKYDVQFAEDRQMSLDLLLNIIVLVFTIVAPLIDTRTWARQNLDSNDYKVIEGNSASINYINLLVISSVSLVANIFLYVFSCDMTLATLYLLNILAVIIFGIGTIIKRFIRIDHHIDKTINDAEAYYFAENKDSETKKNNKKMSEKKTEKIEIQDKVTKKLLLNDVAFDGVNRTHKKIANSKHYNIDKQKLFDTLLKINCEYVEDIYKHTKSIKTRDDVSILTAIETLIDNVGALIYLESKLDKGTDEDREKQTSTYSQLGYTLSFLLHIIKTTPGSETIYMSLVATMNGFMSVYNRTKDLQIQKNYLTMFNSMFHQSIIDKEFEIVAFLNEVFHKTIKWDREDEYFIFVTIYLMIVLRFDPKYITDEDKEIIKNQLYGPTWRERIFELFYIMEGSDTNWFSELPDKLFNIFDCVKNPKYDWYVPENEFQANQGFISGFNKKYIATYWFAFILVKFCQEPSLVNHIFDKVSDECKSLLHYIIIFGPYKAEPLKTAFEQVRNFNNFINGFVTDAEENDSQCVEKICQGIIKEYYQDNKKN